MAAGRKLTADEAELLWRLYGEGVPVNDIAEQMCLQRQSVNQRIWRAGIRRRAARPTQALPGRDRIATSAELDKAEEQWASLLRAARR